MELQKVSDKIQHAVVTLHSFVPFDSADAIYDHPATTRVGSGFFLQPTILVTAAHVIGSMSRGVTVITQGGKHIIASRHFCHEVHDWALIGIPAKHAADIKHTLELSRTPPKVGMSVRIFGNDAGEQFSIHSGHISRTD